VETGESTLGTNLSGFEADRSSPTFADIKYEQSNTAFSFPPSWPAQGQIYPRQILTFKITWQTQAVVS